MPIGLYTRKKQQIENMRKSMLGKNSKPWVSIVCEECKSIFEVTPSRVNKVRFCNLKCRGKFFCGEKSPHWKSNRYEVINSKTRCKQGQYKEWRLSVFKRDDFTCRLSDDLCDGSLQAHHILPWRDNLEGRYDISNGITLCFNHHPRKREIEKELVPLFIKLISK